MLEVVLSPDHGNGFCVTSWQVACQDGDPAAVPVACTRGSARLGLHSPTRCRSCSESASGDTRPHIDTLAGVEAVANVWIAHWPGRHADCRLHLHASWRVAS